MQVFKAYFKIIRRNLVQMSIYLVIFLALSIAFSSLGVGSGASEFEESKPSIAIFNNDDSSFSEGFVDYISDQATIVELANNESTIRDALFYREVVYILTIPKGFGESLKTSSPIKLERAMVADSIFSAYIDRIVDNYFRFAQTYLKFTPNITPEQLVANVADDLSNESTVKLTTNSVSRTKLDNSVYFFNYFAYSLFAIILVGVCSFMLTFNEPELSRRNTASPMTPGSMNAQLIAGNSIFALAVWATLFGTAFILFGGGLFSMVGLYYAANSLTYMLVCVSISFAIGTFIRNQSTQAAVVNILALGLSFLTGVFVPQEFLGDTVLKIGSFTPTYWYVRANHKIISAGTNLRIFDGTITREILTQLIFVFALFAIAIVLQYKKRRRE